MNFIFYDLETSGKNTEWSQILQVAAALVNENFEIIDSFQMRCKLKPGLVPEPNALNITNTTLSQLLKTNLTHYDLIKEVQRKFKSWSPAIYIGFNSINFDEEILRKSFFKSLLEVYLTSMNGNQRADLLKITRSSVFYNKNFLKTALSNKGNITFKLEELTKLNNIDHNAHDAMGDVLASIKLANLIKAKNPELWRQTVLRSDKKKSEEFMNDNKIFCLNNFHYGKMSCDVVTYLCDHPKYGYAQCFDLSVDPILIVDLSLKDLKKRLNEKPNLIKSIALNKHPAIFSIDFLVNIEDVDLNLFNHRAEIIHNNPKFIENILILLKDKYDIEEEFKPQLEIFAEESLYQLGFPSNKDRLTMELFNNEPWDKKFEITNIFTDQRYKFFSQKLIYEEAPDYLPKDIFNKIHKNIANQILTLDNVNWFTLPKAYKQIDDLRSDFELNNNEKKLFFLNEINDYLEKLELIYEPAKYL